jgi:hypothetical protein
MKPMMFLLVRAVLLALAAVVRAGSSASYTLTPEPQRQACRPRRVGLQYGGKLRR